jgi:hypothetical protein
MARDAIGIASEIAQQRLGDNTSVVTGLTNGHTNGATNGHMNDHTNGLTNGTNGTSARREYKPDSFIEVEEHVLLHPTRKTKVISIGCGFSGMQIFCSKCAVIVVHAHNIRSDACS